MAEKDVPQYRRGWLEQLPGELTRWEQSGLISNEQAGAIRALYPAPERSGSRLTRFLTVMAVILIGLGVVLFVAAHWEEMDRWLKVTLLLVAMLGSYGSGWWLSYGRGSYPKVGRALILLGCLIYGADIFLIAQIFHLSAHWPNGLLLWSLGTLAVAWATHDELPLTLAALLRGIWTASEQGGFGRLNGWYLLLNFGLVLPLGGRLRSHWALGLTALGTGLWWLVGTLEAQGHDVPGVAMVAVGLLGLALWGIAVYGAGAAMPRWGSLSLRLAGSLMALIGLFVLSFGDLLKNANLREAPLSVWPPLAAGVLLALALAGAYLLARRQRWEGIGAALVALAASSIWFLPGNAWAALPTNLALLAAIGGLLIVGIRTRSSLLLAAALVGFGADVIGRYFDFFWATLDRSLFFLAGGLLLLAVGALLERQGRRLARDWEVTEDA